VAVRVAPVTVREMRRVVESVGPCSPLTRPSSAPRWRPRRGSGGGSGRPRRRGQLMVRIADEEQRYLLAQNEAQLRQSLQRLG